MKFLKKIISIAIIFLIVDLHHHESPIQDRSASFHSEDCIDQDCFNERTDCETCLTQNRLAFQSIRSDINTTSYEDKYLDNIFSFEKNSLCILKELYPIKFLSDSSKANIFKYLTAIL